MRTLGIIPAGGDGSRWGGYYKEFLPYKEGGWLINRTIDAMRLGGATDIAVLSNEAKLAAHAKHLRKYNNIFYTSLRRDNINMWSGVQDIIPMCQDINYFGMPDTFYPDNIFLDMFPYLELYDFIFGTFWTKIPERFGVIKDGKILNKSRDLGNTTPRLAWGTLAWTKKVSDFWLKWKPKDFLTDAIQMAMDNFRWTTRTMDYYYDMASWEDYEKFLKDDKWKSTP